MLQTPFFAIVLRHVGLAVTLFVLVFMLSTLIPQWTTSLLLGAFWREGPSKPTNALPPDVLRQLADIQRASLLMGVAYVFGAIGAYVRIAFEETGSASDSTARGPAGYPVSTLEVKLTSLRPFVGGFFGLISFLTIESGVAGKLLYTGADESLAERLEPRFAGVAIIAFFVGTFASEFFGFAKRRADSWAGADQANIDKTRQLTAEQPTDQSSKSDTAQ